MDLYDLQTHIQNRQAFTTLTDYIELCQNFLLFLTGTSPTRIISPTHHNYIFYQYDQAFNYQITRPLNSELFIEDSAAMQLSADRFLVFLGDLQLYQEQTRLREEWQHFIAAREINKVVYTLQQSIGCIGDSFQNPNQARKRIGQLFENLIKLIIQQIGLQCQSRTITLPIPGFPGYTMQYELDIVFSRDKAILTADTAQDVWLLSR